MLGITQGGLLTPRPQAITGAGYRLAPFPGPGVGDSTQLPDGQKRIGSGIIGLSTTPNPNSANLFSGNPITNSASLLPLGMSSSMKLRLPNCAVPGATVGPLESQSRMTTSTLLDPYHFAYPTRGVISYTLHQAFDGTYTSASLSRLLNEQSAPDILTSPPTPSAPNTFGCSDSLSSTRNQMPLATAISGRPSDVFNRLTSCTQNSPNLMRLV
ncbi:unnamed protein product [Protopolystoma xenopodis]|uniref:Uncharacterized protein n=1 Tax=Protopolystoma xenopodis TaxID=117903 RepID=A0A3S5CHB8_9PLAT|nr:unnamed protein product [Protopolystoma xenopodis]